MTPQHKAIVLTALSVEYMAVRAHLTNIQEVTHPRGTVYEQGIFLSINSTWRIAIVEIGQGNPAAAVEAERAIQYFEPDIILFVGVAGGLKDVGLGDVVAATKVYGYESGKDEASFKPRPDLGNSTYRLEQRARAEAKKGTWSRRIEPPSSLIPRCFVGPIAAGAKVVASTRSTTYKFIKSHYGDALAVEMEGYGFLEAVRVNPGVEALVVRGISDLIDKKRQSDARGTQEVAAKNASAFAFEVLANLEIPAGATVQDGKGLHGFASPDQKLSENADFRNDPRIDELIKNVGVGDWDAARDAAIDMLLATTDSGHNELFESLLRYQEYPHDEDMRWGALITIESFAELAPWLFGRKLLVRMANNPDFSIRSSAASICMTFAQFAPDLVPTDILLKLARYDEDWYVMAPAFAALKSMARNRPAILYIFFKQLKSSDRYVREYAANALSDIADTEPYILHPEQLKRELTRLRQLKDNIAAEFIAKALPKVEKAKRGSAYKYHL